MKAIILFLLASTLFPNSITYYYFQQEYNDLPQHNRTMNNIQTVTSHTKTFNNGFYQQQVHQQQSTVKRYEYAVDILQYANNLTEFFNYYNSITIDFSLRFFHHSDYNTSLTKRIQNKDSAYPDNYSYFISKVNARGLNRGWNTDWDEFLAIYSKSFDDDTNTHEGIMVVRKKLRFYKNYK